MIAAMFILLFEVLSHLRPIREMLMMIMNKKQLKDIYLNFIIIIF